MSLVLFFTGPRLSDSICFYQKKKGCHFVCIFASLLYISSFLNGVRRAFYRLQENVTECG